MTLLLLHAGATLLLAGLIWTIQVVHYPLMDDVGRGSFRAYHVRHGRGITLLVAPLMLAELLTAAWLVFAPPPGVGGQLTWAGLGLVVVAWALTAFVAVPLHARLGRGFDARAHTLLVNTNWARTVAWTLRGGLALVLIAQHAEALS